MVAEVKASRTRKPAQPVTVRPLDVLSGLYATLSSDGHTWYMTDVKARTCTCRAGQDHFTRCKLGACRHLIAARVVARGLASMTPTARATALHFQNIRVNVAAVDVAALDRPLHQAPAVATSALAHRAEDVFSAVHPAVAALLDAYPTAA